MTTHSNLQHENNTHTQKEIFSLIGVSVLFSGLWFINACLPNCRLDDNSDIQNIASKPGIVAVPYLDCSSVHKKQLDQNSECSCNSDYRYEKSSKSEISCARRAYFLTAESESADTVLRLRGGGSGHGSGHGGGSLIIAGAKKTPVAESSSGSLHSTARGVLSANPHHRSLAKQAWKYNTKLTFNSTCQLIKSNIV